MSDITTGSVTANGLDFGYLAAGPEDGPLALLLHGFPDSAHTWRHLMPELAAAGYRAVAPFMRGYAPTSVPEDGAFQTGALAADAVALHEALGGGSDAVVIGHDWGAFTAYGAANVAPGRWRKAVAMSVPPMSVMTTAFFDYEQLKRSFYIFVFQTPLAELALNRAFIEGLWRDWSPADGRDRTADVDHVMECLATPANAEAAIGYYRAMLDPSKLIERYAAEQEAASPAGRGQRADPRLAVLTRSAARSPIMMAGALVCPRVISGRIETSATRRPSTPRTRSSGSTTASSSVPMRHVPVGWYSVSACPRT